MTANHLEPNQLGFFYSYRGNGYGKFASEEEAQQDLAARKQKDIDAGNGQYASGDSPLFFGSVEKNLDHPGVPKGLTLIKIIKGR